MTQKHIVLSPHLDDAVLSTWRLLGGREDVRLINVFAGIPSAGAGLAGWDQYTGADSSTARMGERLIEDRSALAIAGRSATNLGLLENQYRREPVGEADLRAAVEPHLAADARIWVPAALGEHPDHVAVRELGAALRERGFDVGVYADIPSATSAGWPHWVTGQPKDPFLDNDFRWQRALARSRIAFGEMQATPIRLTPQERDAKLRACRRYRSQMPSLEKGPLQAVTHPALFPFEVYWTTE
jgi:hypothetical protein